MANIIKIPLLGIETVTDENSIEDIIKAVSEASVCFCIQAEKHGLGIEKEIELINENNC
jgi:hypothetical protein